MWDQEHRPHRTVALLPSMIALTSRTLPQAHELSAGTLGCLGLVAGRLGALSLEGIPRMGTDGWRAIGGLTALTRLAVRSRGDNAGLAQVPIVPVLRVLLSSISTLVPIKPAWNGDSLHARRPQEQRNRESVPHHQLTMYRNLALTLRRLRSWLGGVQSHSAEVPRRPNFR